MQTVPQIIEALGGVAGISRSTGIPFTTVDTWRRKNRVPHWRVPTLVALAKKLKKPIRAEDFERSADQVAA